MQNLNYMTSCPCSMCRIDKNHKNKSVEIVKKRNAGRFGLIRRHSLKVKEKYSFKCAVSNSTFDLHYHHLDGQDFYTKTQNLLEFNGICLCGPIHRDYHFNFLLNYSIIAKYYKVNSIPPGAEVSRYTWLEYLKFFKFDIKVKKSSYINCLNQSCLVEQSKIPLSDLRFGGYETITLEKLEKAIQKFCLEYKGQNYKLSEFSDIPYANDLLLWNKVDSSWRC